MECELDVGFVNDILQQKVRLFLLVLVRINVCQSRVASQASFQHR